MRSMLFLALFGGFFLASCNNEKSNDGKSGDGKDRESENTKDRIIGIWTDSSSGGNALFDIRKDSIYHIVEKEAYPYIVYKDTLKVNFGESMLHGLVRFNEDTMTVQTEGIQSKYWRFKN
jgi:hypothetical protein